MYDRHDRIGGLLVYGIPNFKLEKSVVERRAQVLIDGGIAFRSTARSAATSDSRSCARATTPVHRHRRVPGRDISAPGSGLGNIVPALEYLIASNRKGLGEAVPAFDSGALDAAGKRWS